MNNSETPSAVETVRRRDGALRRALSTPSQPKHRKVRESSPAKAPAPSAKRGKRRQAAEGY